MKHEITTVGKLREALADVPADTPIWAQVCGTNGGAWSLTPTIATIPAASPETLVIALRHPELETLPDWP